MHVQRYRELCQKNQEENYFFDKYFFRKISIYFTILFIRLNIRANHATFLSLLAVLGSCYFLMSNSPINMAIAVLLIFLYHLLDHVDGELARYYLAVGLQKPSIQGKYFDVLIHKYSTNLMLFFIGISVYRFYGYEFAVILGFAACIGMSAFPNLIASQVIVQRIAKDNNSVFEESVQEILYLLEKKRDQINKMQQAKAAVKARKLITEMLFFPGALFLIMMVVTADIFYGGFLLFSYEVNVRLLFLLFITPIYLANALRQSRKWIRMFEKVD